MPKSHKFSSNTFAFSRETTREQSRGDTLTAESVYRHFPPIAAYAVTIPKHTHNQYQTFLRFSNFNYFFFTMMKIQFFYHQYNARKNKSIFSASFGFVYIDSSRPSWIFPKHIVAMTIYFLTNVFPKSF